VVYENEGHAISQPAHLVDIQKRSVEWFDRYLK
jgi:dipeptidyl aminopeptidase/acylaminoacyl peptidase